MNKKGQELGLKNTHFITPHGLDEVGHYTTAYELAVITDYALNNYGLKLSDYERISNIGELDCQYLILVEVPREDVQFILDNMDHLVLTIPVDNGPNWMIEEIKQSDN